MKVRVYQTGWRSIKERGMPYYAEYGSVTEANQFRRLHLFTYIEKGAGQNKIRCYFPLIKGAKLIELTTAQIEEVCDITGSPAEQVHGIINAVNELVERELNDGV